MIFIASLPAYLQLTDGGIFEVPLLRSYASNLTTLPLLETFL